MTKNIRLLEMCAFSDGYGGQKEKEKMSKKEVISIYDMNNIRRPYMDDDGNRVEELRITPADGKNVRLDQIPATYWAAMVEETELFEHDEHVDILKIKIRPNTSDWLDMSIQKEDDGSYWAYIIAKLGGIIVSKFKTINYTNELLRGSFTERLSKLVFSVEFLFNGTLYVPTTEQEQDHIENTFPSDFLRC